MKLVKEFMRERVIYVQPEDSIFDVAKAFSMYKISGSPVVEGGKVVGMLSEGDIIKFMSIKLPGVDLAVEDPHALTLLMANMVREGVEFIQEAKKISRSKVKDFMNIEVITVTPETTIVEAAGLMDKYKVNRLPVVQEGQLVGIISRSDVIKAIAE